MDFVKIDGNTLLFSIPLLECKGCHRKMIFWAENNFVLGWCERRVSEIGIVKESYAESGICALCLRKGGFSRECDVCSKDKIYPQEFAFDITHHAQYTDEGTSHDYICIDCVSKEHHHVIDLLSKADEIEDLRVKKVEQELRNGKWVPKGSGQYEKSQSELGSLEYKRLHMNEWPIENADDKDG